MQKKQKGTIKNLKEQKQESEIGLLEEELPIEKILRERSILSFETLVPIIVLSFLFFIAISSYKDYSNRVKIAEAISILAGLKIPAEKYYDSKGVWPAIDMLTTKHSSKYVENITSNKLEFYFEATMKNDDSPVSSRTLRLYFDTNKNEWTCSKPHPNRIPYEYLPSVCK